MVKHLPIISGPTVTDPPHSIGAAEFPRVYRVPEPSTSRQIVDRLTGNIPGLPLDIPGIDIDAAQIADIPEPERQTEKSRKYEVFAAYAGIAGSAHRHLGSTLAAGTTWSVESTFVPDFWRVTIHGNAADYVLIDVDGTGYNAMAILNNNGSATYPARGILLAVVAPSTNTAAITASVEAMAGLKTEGD